MINPESKRPITIEDLLRLKRAERPPAEFWNDFDRALRAKQLAALVGKRPWWQIMPRAFAGFRRYRIPIGAAAIVAVTFVSLREYRGTSAQPPSVSSNAVASAVVSTTTDLRKDSVVNVTERHDIAQNPSHVIATSDVAPPVATLASDATAPGEISRIIPLIGTSSNESAQEELSPSARAIAANLATVRGSEPVLTATLLSSANGSEARVARAVVEPLQQIASPTERRRANLYTAMASMASFEGPSRTGERAAARLSEDELYDRIHRFGARANSLNMKF